MPAARFATPFAAPLILLAALGVSDVAVRWSRPARILLLGAAIVLLLIQARNLARPWELHRSGRANPALDARSFLAIGEWLAPRVSEEDLLLAFEIGAVGYASRCRILDHEGLVTPEIAALIHAAGGYGNVRYGKDAAALSSLVRICERSRPSRFLVRSTSNEEFALDLPLPPGSATERVQNELLEAFGETMVLEREFELSAPEGARARYLLLRRPPPIDRR
jgi:hypothetical protein